MAKSGNSNPLDSRTARNQDEELTNPFLPPTGVNEVSVRASTPLQGEAAVRCPLGPALLRTACRRRQGVLVKRRRNEWSLGCGGVV